jgi:hypothetical protein
MVALTDPKIKDPDSVLDYTLDWSAWLDDDTIVTSTFLVDSGLTKDSDSKTTTTTTVWLSGGTAGTNYGITNRITTTAGRTADRTFRIWVRNQ